MTARRGSGSRRRWSRPISTAYRNECCTVGLKIPLAGSEFGVTMPLGLGSLLQYLSETVERGLHLGVKRRPEGAGTLRKSLLKVGPQAPGVAVEFLATGAEELL